MSIVKQSNIMENKKIKLNPTSPDDNKLYPQQHKLPLTFQQKIELRKHALNIALNITIQLKTSRTTLNIPELIDKAEYILQWIIKDI